MSREARGLVRNERAGAITLGALSALLLAAVFALRAHAADAPVSVVAATAPTAAHRADMTALGLKYKTAWDLYQALEVQEKGGAPLAKSEVPDWGGVYTRPLEGGIFYDLDSPGGKPTAKWTPEYQARLDKYVANLAKGIEYDPLSQCESPGHPRWLTLPFLREHIVTPNQTTMIAEAFNSVRRIYTDGRDHIPEADRYPLENGDSIGFWSGGRLFVHTNQLSAHMYERAQGDYSEQVETVEIWRQVDARTLEADVWVYDPPALREPWYTTQRYIKLTNPDNQIRIRHWSCKGNPNNEVYETPDGGSQFRDFTFTTEDDKGAPAK
jgi:hypothetical protein